MNEVLGFEGCIEQKHERICGFKPAIRQNSVVLVLGTLPGQKSLEEMGYYSDPRNNFWRILFQACGEPFERSNEAQTALLEKYGIALWDVLESAIRKTSNNDTPRETSDDKGIREETANDLPGLLAKYPTIKLILFHSNDAYKYFQKHFKNTTIPYIRVASPSGQNRKNIEEKALEWKAALSSVIPQIQMPHRLERKNKFISGIMTQKKEVRIEK